MAGVEPRQTSVGKQDAVAQACLLAEDDGHVTDTDDLVDLGMGHIPFAQSRVGTRIARNVEVGILGARHRGVCASKPAQGAIGARMEERDLVHQQRQSNAPGGRNQRPGARPDGTLH